MPKTVLTRNGARQLFADSTLTYASVTDDSLARLRKILDRHMRASDCMRGSLRMRRHRPRWRVSAGRQWADDTNVVPILAGFCEWVSEEVRG